LERELFSVDNQDTTASALDIIERPTPTTIGPKMIQRFLGGAWSMHLPFAWDLARELKPEAFVELGVYRGESYFAFCQSVAENGLPTMCYGVDTWRGDIHMGPYGPEIRREVEAYNRRYSSFSTLLRTTFDEALSRFADASIDLLHIDGGHTYEEVKHDFTNWLPKLSNRGIILFHDVTERENDFGVWRLWQEIASKGRSFVFDFGHGLGVWKGSAVSENDPPFIRGLLSADEAQQREITAHYAIAAASISCSNAEERPNLEIETARLQVFAPRDGSYSEDDCSDAIFAKRAWRRVEIKLCLPAQNGNARFRFDPGSEIGVVEIAGIRVLAASTREILWSARGSVELSRLKVGGTALTVPDERVFRILNFGPDPQVLLPPLRDLTPDSLVIFQIWLRLDTSAETIARCFADLQQQHQQEIGRKVAALLDLEQQTLALATELSEHKMELGAFRSEVDRLEREAWENRVRRADFAARLKQRDEWIEEVKDSLAWKAAKPLWKLQRHFTRRKDEKRQEGRPSHELVFALDDPGVWNAARNSLKLKGWCFSRGGPEVVGVRAKIGRKSYFARYGLRREDVAEAAGAYPAALYSGFLLTLPVTPTSGKVRLEAITQNGPWQCFLEHSIALRDQAPDPSGFDQRHEPEPGATESIVLPLYGNGQRPVLYPNATANQVVSLLTPLIERHLSSAKKERPIFSIITPCFNTSPRWLIEAGASLLNQTCVDWEWCLIDDDSKNSETKRALDAFAGAHPGFRVKYVPKSGISSATNEGLNIARGDFVSFLDHDDLLHAEALQAMRDKLGEGFDAVYSDEDKLNDEEGTLIEPFFKPDWSPEYFRGAMYVGHLLCVRRELACQVRFDNAFDGVQDFDFMLRVSETGARIGHVPKILYHWRKTPGSIAVSSHAKPQAAILQQNAVNAHLKRMELPAEAKTGSLPHRLKIVPAPRTTSPKISIVIPTKDAPDLLSRCLKSLFENTSYSNFEVILIDNDTSDRDAIELMRVYPVRRVYLPNPFNFSRANNLGAETATGEYLVFLNNDTEVVGRQWINQLLYYAEQPDVGAAGALLLHDNGAVQHAGVVLGMRGTADHAMRGFRAKSDGYAGSLSCAREVSAVTAACMMMRKSLFEGVGRFNEHFFTIYQDVDLCLRLRQRGLRIIWTPEALLLHHESLSRQAYYDFVDRYLLLDQWEDTIRDGDPYYNRNLNAERGDYSLRQS
jgi:GT2 family glycosyltransferase